jgi:molecular chaperone GrpE
LASHKQGHHKEHESAAAAAAASEASAEQNVQSGNGGDTAEVPEAEAILKLATEKQELMNTLVRRQADFENFKKRVEKEKHNDRQRGIEVMIEHMLPVLDAFDRALAGPVSAGNADYRKGFEMIRGQMWAALSKQGLQRIETAGKEFDPTLHHAIESVADADAEEGTVVGEMQPGYMFNGRVLRPAMVRVAAGRAN